MLSKDSSGAECRSPRSDRNGPTLDRVRGRFKESLLSRVEIFAKTPHEPTSLTGMTE